MNWFQRMMLGVCVLMDEATDGTEGTGGGTATADPPSNGGGTNKTQSNKPANTGLTAEQLQSVTSSITQAVQEEVKTISEAQNKLRADFEQASQPRTNGSQMFGAPGIRKGEDPMTSRGFQTARAMMMVKGELDAENCKVETEMSQKLAKFYCQQHGFDRAAPNSVLIPMASSEIAMNDPELAQEVRQSMAAGVQGADLGMAAHMAQQMGYGQNRINQALSVYDDTAGGIWTRSDIAGEFLPLIRNMEVMSRLGARTLTLPPNGVLNFGSQTSSTTGYWVGEADEITGSTFGTGLKSMRAKKCAALVTYPNEFVRFASASIEAFIRADVAKTLALLIDSAALEGVGTDTKPKGIINYGIQTHTAGTVATDGNTFEPEDPSLMLAKLEDSNFDIDREGVSWLMRGTMWRNLLNRRAGALDSNDAADNTVGPWLFRANRDDIAKGAPSMLEGHPVVRSTQVSNTRTKGSGTDLTYILAGIWQNLIIGRHGVLEVATADQNNDNFKTDQRSIRFIQHVDTLVTYPESFVMCDTIDMDLPA